MKIKINKLKLFGYHGVYDEEKKDGQDFQISLTITLKSKPVDDDIRSAVDYSLIVEDVKETFESKRYNLIESLAMDISDRLMLDQRIKSVSVSVEKINPPIDAELNSIQVIEKNKR